VHRSRIFRDTEPQQAWLVPDIGSTKGPMENSQSRAQSVDERTFRIASPARIQMPVCSALGVTVQDQYALSTAALSSSV